jgi:peptidyl-tRNA hydrolase
MLLLVRKDIGMGQGKIAAQCGHAAMGIIANYLVPQHELMLLSPNRVENNWAEDVQVWYQPAMGESSDADEDEDEDYDDEDDEQCPAVGGEKPKTILELLAQKNQEMQKKSGENDKKKEKDEKNTEQNNETTSKTSVTTKSHTADPNDPSTRYLRLTPRQIRKELYKTTAPIEILMKHLIAKWVYRGQAKIAVKVNSDGEMDTLLRSLRNVGVPFYEIYDAGLTQIAANTRTVVAVGPFPADIIDPLLGHLKLL